MVMRQGFSIVAVGLVAGSAAGRRRGGLAARVRSTALRRSIRSRGGGDVGDDRGRRRRQLRSGAPGDARRPVTALRKRNSAAFQILGRYLLFCV